MSKFSYEQKLEAVLKVKNEQMTRRGAAKLLGVSKTMVNRWVDRYEQFGEEVLRQKRRKYDGQFKIDVVEYMQAAFVLLMPYLRVPKQGRNVILLPCLQQHID